MTKLQTRNAVCKQMWLLLDSAKDSKQRQILEKLVCLPTISTNQRQANSKQLCVVYHVEDMLIFV